LDQKKQTANFNDNSSMLYKCSHKGLINENNKTTIITFITQKQGILGASSQVLNQQ
jgi:hypothetical protein